MATVSSEGFHNGGRPLAKALYGDLIWGRPGVFRRELNLEAGSELLATLRWPKLFSFEAVAESADGRWIIGRRGGALAGGTWFVREVASGAEVATFRRDWRGRGSARFASGAEYRWGRTGPFWDPRYHWASSGETRLIAFRAVVGWTTRYEMTVDPAARSLAELPVLVVLGGYVMAAISAQRHAS